MSVVVEYDRNGFRKLRYKSSTLFKKVNYLTSKPMVSNVITEYDLRAANISALRQAKAMKKADLDALLELPSYDRKVIIGNMIRVDPRIRFIIADQILKARKRLFMANHIQDDEVLSIKNDAVFVVGRKLKELTFGHMVFRPKHSYSFYLNLDDLELYYDRSRNTVDIKGIKDEVVEEEDHQQGIVSFLARCCSLLMNDRRDELRDYLIRFTEDYKARKLPYRFYRELSKVNAYRIGNAQSGYSINLVQVSQKDVDDLNIIYNYQRFVMPMIHRFL